MLSEKTLSWTLTSKVNIWLGNHFFLSLRWGFNHLRCCKFFFNSSSPPPPLFPTYNLRQNCWENCILGQHFSKHRSCTSSSLFPLKAMLLRIQKKAWSLGVCRKQHWIGGRGFLSAIRRSGNSFVFIGKWTWWGKLSQVVLSGIEGYNCISSDLVYNRMLQYD